MYLDKLESGTIKLKINKTILLILTRQGTETYLSILIQQKNIHHSENQSIK